MRDVRLWIATMGGAGLAPAMPGTCGSLLAAGGLWAAQRLWWAEAGTVSPFWWNSALALMVLAMSLMTVALGRWAAGHWGGEDPGPFVLDEGAGVCMTMLFLPVLDGWRQGLVVLCALAGFRIFDIWKPWPAQRLEQLPLGWGILADDLMAAVYANLLCQVVLRGLLP